MRCIQPPFSLWLDDEREAPPGWLWVKTPSEAIRLLKTNLISKVSLDHDLGLKNKTGYDVVLWLEEDASLVYPDLSVPPQMFAHTANAGARRKMELGIRAVYKIWKAKKEKCSK